MNGKAGWLRSPTISVYHASTHWYRRVFTPASTLELRCHVRSATRLHSSGDLISSPTRRSTALRPTAKLSPCCDTNLNLPLSRHVCVHCCRRRSWVASSGSRREQKNANDFRRGEHARVLAGTLSTRLRHPFSGPRPPRPTTQQRLLRGRQHAVASSRGGSETTPSSCRPRSHR